MKTSKILSTGRGLPETILTNQDLEKIVDTSDEWIFSRTGIRQRYIIDPKKNQNLITLAAKAAENCLSKIDFNPQNIDLIICATITSNTIMPSAACAIQGAIGATNACGMDIAAACSGFLFALSIADQYIKNGAAKNVLVFGGDTVSTFLDWTDRSTCILFGDGIAAALLGPVEDDKSRTILSTHIHSNNKNAEALSVKNAHLSTPFMSEQNLDVSLRMDGSRVFKFAVQALSASALEALEYNNLTTQDITLLIPHQANQRILSATAERLGISSEKVYANVERYGNTSAGSIPIAFDEVCEKRLLKSGDRCLLIAFGGGFTYGSVLIQW
jgi:3-oxoacyl-[acyl-carrier-protein] synthase-3